MRLGFEIRTIVMAFYYCRYNRFLLPMCSLYRVKCIFNINISILCYWVEILILNEMLKVLKWKPSFIYDLKCICCSHTHTEREYSRIVPWWIAFRYLCCYTALMLSYNHTLSFISCEKRKIFIYYVFNDGHETCDNVYFIKFQALVTD